MESGGGVKITIDVSDITSSLAQEMADEMALAKDVADKTAIDLHAGLVLRTPKATGRAAGGWMVDTNGPNPIVENNVEYIGRLNDGWSQQAPAGFVEVEMDRATRI